MTYQKQKRDKDSTCQVTASEVKEPFHFTVDRPDRLASLISADHESLDQPRENRTIKINSIIMSLLNLQGPFFPSTSLFLCERA